MSDRHRGENGVEAGWGNKSLRVSGLAPLIVILLAAALAVIVWDNRQMQARFMMEWHAAVTARAAQAQRSEEQHERITRDFRNSLYEVLYVLTLDNTQRSALQRRLEVPERLRPRPSQPQEP